MVEQADLQIELEAARHSLREASDEIAQLSEAATVGEAMLGLTHELSNSLNTMMLQASLVQLKVDPSLREEVAAIRREGNAAAAQLRLLQQYRDITKQEREEVDLNAMVNDVLAPMGRGPTSFDAARDLPPLPVSNKSALRRLLGHLIGLLYSVAPTRTIATRLTNDRHQISLEVYPASAEVSKIAHLFSGNEGIQNARRALIGVAAESLVRLLAVHWHLERRGDEGLAVILEWPPNGA